MQNASDLHNFFANDRVLFAEPVVVPVVPSPVFPGADPGKQALNSWFGCGLADEVVSGVVMKPGVLVVEDDAKTAELIRLYLDRDGYPVTVARNGREGLELARRHQLGLVLLDVMMPEMDGLEVCRLLREESDVGIILVTARTDELDTLRALDLGADDYVTKPFRPRELVARVRAVLRRRGANEANDECELEFGRLRIDGRRHEVRVDGVDRRVTKKEFQLLVTLAKEPGKAFSRLELLEKAFGYNYEGLERTIDAHVRNLRKKIERDAERPEFIETVYGVGYRFAEHRDAP